MHPSTIVCPLTTAVQEESEILRVHLRRSRFGLKEDCDVMIDQIRAIDNRRLMKRVGLVDRDAAERIRENLKVVLDLE